MALMVTYSHFRFAVCCGSIFAACGCQSVERLAWKKGPATPVVVADKSLSDGAQPEAPAAEDPAPESSKQDDVQLTGFESPSGSGLSEVVPQVASLPPAPTEAAGSAPLIQPIPEQDLAGSTGITLEQLEQLALQNNPAISQASASVSKASGFRNQVGTYPNPNVGYAGQQLADKNTDQHLAYVEQEIVTARKLKLNQRVLDQEVQSQLWEVEAQRYRVLTDIRQHFYEALAAQQRHDLAVDFQKVASEGVRVAEIRRKALEGSVPEVLQTEIQLNEVELILQRAEIAYHAAWQQLLSIAGVPQMPQVRLIGTLRVSTERKDWDQTYLQLLSSSPSLQAARARVTRSMANMSRQEVQAIPNLQTLTSAGYDYGTQNSLFQIQMGIALPIYNQNLGNISAAQAEYCRAVHDVRRLELLLQSQLAQASQQYDSAVVTVTRYETQILPKAQQTLDLSEKAYAAGEFGFLQVLVARRTFFDSNLQYNQALIELARAKWLIEGMLLDGGLTESVDTTMDDGLRGQTLSGQ